MKKIWLLTSLLVGSLLVTGCSVTFEPNDSDVDLNVNEEYDLKDDLGRMQACADKVGFYLNSYDYEIEWEEEEGAWGGAFSRAGHVVRWEEWNLAEDDVQCDVDWIDWTVNVEFSNHKYNWELQTEEVSEEAEEE